MTEGQVLDRVVKGTYGGWQLEADLRHAEFIIEDLGLIHGKPGSTPGVDVAITSAVETYQEEEDALPTEEAMCFRGTAAWLNDLQPDRPDIQYTVKEVRRLIARPTARALEMLKTIGRYWKGQPRLVAFWLANRSKSNRRPL